MRQANATFFVYGTLQFPAIAAAVLGRTPSGVPAVLDDYARHAVHDAPFPGIVPAPGSVVEGVIYNDVGPREQRRLDTFEGDLYHRERVLVRRREDDEPVEAITYVVRPRWRTTLASAGWDPEAFARRWHDTYVERVEAARRAGELG